MTEPMIIVPGAEEAEPPFDPESLVVVCVSPAYGYIGVAEFQAGQLLLLKHALALVPVQVSSRLAQPGATPVQDTALCPIIGGKAGAVAALSLPSPMPFYRVGDLLDHDRNALYRAYMDMTQYAWFPPPSDA